MNRVGIILLLFVLVLGFAEAQEEGQKARVVIIPFQNTTGDDHYDQVCDAITDAVHITLKFLNDYTVFLSEETPKDYGTKGLASFAKQHRADNVIFGMSFIGTNGTVTLRLAVFDRFENNITISHEKQIYSILEVFETADKLVIAGLERFSNTHIGWGQIILTNEGENGRFMVYIDNQYIGENLLKISNILIGRHSIRVVQERPFKDHELLRQVVDVEENGTEQLSFRVPDITEIEASGFEMIENQIKQNAQKGPSDPAAQFEMAFSLLERADASETLLGIKKNFQKMFAEYKMSGTLDAGEEDGDEIVDKDAIMERIEEIKEEQGKTAANKSEKPEGEFVLVEAGTFLMGSAEGSESPIHTVTLTGDFYISRYEVTFEQYDAFCTATGRKKPRDEGMGRGEMPVVRVTWQDAIDYCNWRSEEEGLTPCYSLNSVRSNSGQRSVSGDAYIVLIGGKKEEQMVSELVCDFTANGYRLPTEAEWEFAARGGTKSREYTHAGGNLPPDVAWYSENSGGRSRSPGKKQANELGIYDMSGNVWEWCWDWYGGYHADDETDPTGPPTGTSRIVRGGGWKDGPRACSITNRGNIHPNFTYDDLGFRVVRTAK